jgi:hypothetical protein
MRKGNNTAKDKEYQIELIKLGEKLDKTVHTGVYSNVSSTTSRITEVHSIYISNNINVVTINK